MFFFGKKAQEKPSGRYMERDDLDRHVLYFADKRSRREYTRLSKEIAAIQDYSALDSFILSETKEDTENRAEPAYVGFLDLLNRRLLDGLGVAASNEDAHVLFGQLSTTLLQTECKDHRTSVLRNVPPPNIHRMQRDDAWIGDIASSSILHNALAKAGLTIQAGSRFYDYGCSSGSLLRVLAYVYPDVSFVGTDPVGSSIEWAQANLKFDNLEFFHQDQTAPINSLEDESVDTISAISIFSHHGLKATQNWLEELHRILKKGGVAVITTHGIGSIRHYNSLQEKPIIRYKQLALHLLASGYAFEEIWLDEDDVGNTATDADWGSTYFTHAKMRNLLKGSFEILLFESRLNQGNQDVYVIRKI